MRLPTFLTLAHVEGRKNAEVLELRGAVAGRLAEVEAFAAGRLELVDLLLVLRERRLVDLDAGRLSKSGMTGSGNSSDHMRRELTRGRSGMLDIERARQADGSGGKARLQQAAAAHLCGAHEIQSRLFGIVYLHLFPPKCRKTIPATPM